MCVCVCGCVCNDGAWRGRRCWGNSVFGKSTPPALKNVLLVSLGATHSCAIVSSTGTCTFTASLASRPPHSCVLSLLLFLLLPLSPLDNRAHCLSYLHSPLHAGLVCWSNCSNCATMSFIHILICVLMYVYMQGGKGGWRAGAATRTARRMCLLLCCLRRNRTPTRGGGAGKRGS